MNERYYEALEDCLAAIESGANIETCLSLYPEMAEDLRSLLDTAQIASSMRDDQIPDAAFQRSRSLMLRKAASLHDHNHSKPVFGRLPRIAFVALSLALLFFLTWQGLVVVAAQALPGDTLYSFKRTAEDLSLRIAQNADTKRSIEVKYEQRRVDEVRQLIKLGREEKVQFEGVLEKQDPQLWNIDGIPVRLTSATQVEGSLDNGMVVRVNGDSQSDGVVLADAIHLYSYELIGKVESISRVAWVISGAELQTLDTSQIDPAAHVGDQVIVLVQVMESGPPRALAILRLLQPALIETAIPQETPNSTPEVTEIEFSGQVDEIGPNTWIINGRTLQITAGTEIKANIAVGDYVSIHALVLSDGVLSATEISLVEISPNGNDDDQIEQGEDQINPTEGGNHDQPEEDLSSGTGEKQEGSPTEIKPGDSGEGDGHDGGDGGEDISPTETPSSSDESINPEDGGEKVYSDSSQSWGEKIDTTEGDHGDGQSLVGQIGQLLPGEECMTCRLPYLDVSRESSLS